LHAAESPDVLFELDDFIELAMAEVELLSESHVLPLNVTAPAGIWQMSAAGAAAQGLGQFAAAVIVIGLGPSELEHAPVIVPASLQRPN